MLDWIAKNTGTLQVAISLLTGIVWLAYLHILWLNFRRQRQAVILINRSVAQDENAHCFVTNMGAEPRRGAPMKFGIGFANTGPFAGGPGAAMLGQAAEAFEAMDAGRARYRMVLTT